MAQLSNISSTVFGGEYHDGLSEIEWAFHNRIFERSLVVCRFYYEGKKEEQCEFYRTNPDVSYKWWDGDIQERTGNSIASLHANLMGPNFVHMVNDYRGSRNLGQLRRELIKDVMMYVENLDVYEYMGQLLDMAESVIRRFSDYQHHHYNGVKNVCVHLYLCDSEVFMFLVGDKSE